MPAAPLDGVRHLIWDWNGTLLDDAWLCVSVMSGLLEARGLPGLTAERYQRVFRFPVRDYYEDLGFDLEAEPFEVVGTAFIEGYHAREHAAELQPAARDVLAAVAAAGIGQSVLSASQQQNLEGQARRRGVAGHFQRLVGLEDHYAGGKVAQGRALIAALEVAPESVLMVGDTVHDAEVAGAMGVRCVLVPSGHQAPERLAATGAPVLPGLDALL
jgi:phosphoglycolate phosphatase